MRGIIVIGGGGHAKVLIEILLSQAREVIGYTDFIDHGDIYGVPCLGNDSKIEHYLAENIVLVNGLGSTGDNTRRKHLYDLYKEKGYKFTSVIHPSAIISPSVVIDEGVQIMAGVIIQADCYIGSNSIINTRASVDHDSKIGKHVHIAPGVILSGGVEVQEGTHLGTGSVVIQGILVGKESLVGAGAVVIKNIPDRVKVAGVPAKVITTSS
ncbi:acetyltransferase [Brevibacillus sp. HB1.1]|uniref:acetyltransferase n=1 Tax=Brevibacillus sp. HB1.1 TaxID=2738808 RepID=UPI0015763619|nr:acetyltransferase [Brevibacillus sp. HB1.1]NTU31058.1 acetyltransferase [Brevibacillus sp. HB1.1]